MKSREFFLSKTASCDDPMHDVELVKARGLWNRGSGVQFCTGGWARDFRRFRRGLLCCCEVKKDTNAKRAQLAQRFRVKQVKTVLQSAVQNKLSTKTFQEALMGVPGEEEQRPAVELHLFPEDPKKANSSWRALLVPTTPKAFGTWYLCQPAPSSPRCIAKLPFEALPFHPSSMVGGWYSVLDRYNASPARLISLMEAVLACGSVLLLVLAISAVYVLVRGRGASKGDSGEDSDPEDSLIAKTNWSYPCNFHLTQHAQLRHGL